MKISRNMFAVAFAASGFFYVHAFPLVSHVFEGMEDPVVRQVEETAEPAQAAQLTIADMHDDKFCTEQVRANLVFTLPPPVYNDSSKCPVATVDEDAAAGCLRAFCACQVNFWNYHPNQNDSGPEIACGDACAEAFMICEEVEVNNACQKVVFAEEFFGICHMYLDDGERLEHLGLPSFEPSV